MTAAIRKELSLIKTGLKGIDSENSHQLLQF